MNYFASDMSKSTNTVVYFDWKSDIYTYVYGICRTQFMLSDKYDLFVGLDNNNQLEYRVKSP
jgi:hypothetical protein